MLPSQLHQCQTDATLEERPCRASLSAAASRGQGWDTAELALSGQGAGTPRPQTSLAATLIPPKVFSVIPKPPSLSARIPEMGQDRPRGCPGGIRASAGSWQGTQTSPKPHQTPCPSPSPGCALTEAGMRRSLCPQGVGLTHSRTHPAPAPGSFSSGDRPRRGCHLIPGRIPPGGQG